MQSFPHLHVASGYSLRHGASSPAALVARAAEHGMDALALTDRDGLYGAVKFATACTAAGIDPILGVDLAVEPMAAVVAPRSSVAGGRVPGVDRGGRRRHPVRGGESVDPRHPRVTVLAHAADPASGLPAARGWAALCRLVSAAQLRGERGRCTATMDLIAQHAVDPVSGGAALTVLLGPDSSPGRALLARRADLAAVALRLWRHALPPGCLAIEVVCHQGPPDSPTGSAHARRLLDLAEECGVPAVLTNAVRYATPDQAMTVDVLDAARRLVVLGSRHTDRSTAAGHLADGADMAARAAMIAGDATGAGRLLRRTAGLADRCRLDPAADLSVGAIHLPEPEVLGLHATTDLQAVLAVRCGAGLDRRYGHRPVPGLHGPVGRPQVEQRLADELATVAALGFAGYFLAVADVCELIRDMGVRVAARGSGAGSLICHVLGISGVDPIRHDLLMERFCTPLRAKLPDIDVDVEAARRLDVYRAVLDRFGGDRVTCVSMMDTYRVRHAIRDAAAALGMDPGEIDAIATAFPHIRARDARAAIAELPELRASGLNDASLGLLFDIVERLDGLPRHIALHPCGVILSDARLLDRTPVEASWMGFPMTQFDKDDVEVVGLLKLDILGVRMQSAMAYAVDEVARVDGVRIDLDDESCVAHDDEATYRLIRSARTLGCFQIESPGQRELVGKFAPETFNDIVIDISLFRPGPVKSDMVAPFLRARQGWAEPEYLHPTLIPILAETFGVVVFHEQVIRIVAATIDCSLAEADEVRRALGSREGQDGVRNWFIPRAVRNGYSHDAVGRIWEVLKAFASFGFCKAHAAAFALPTYQSAWLKAHHPAAFLAGVLTHDPGMYPKRLILDDARNLGIAVLGLDVNRSDEVYRVERVEQLGAGEAVDEAGDEAGDEKRAAGSGYGIRLSLADVKGISSSEISRIIANRPYASLADFWHRCGVSRPTAERLVLTGAFDDLHGLGGRLGEPGPGGGSGYQMIPVMRRRGRLTRRDLLIQVAELDRWSRAAAPRGAGRRLAVGPGDPDAMPPSGPGSSSGTAAAARRQSQAPRPAQPPTALASQLALDLGDAPDVIRPSLLPDMTSAERVAAELEILGLDASRHVLDFYRPLIDALGVVRSPDLVRQRTRSELLVAGVKVATQTPPIRSGRRVVFLTLDDATGAVDATFFEDVQGPYATTVFGSWLLLVRGVLRRTGPRGVSLRATGAWELPALWAAWRRDGLDAVLGLIDTAPRPVQHPSPVAVSGAAASRSARPVVVRPPAADGADDQAADGADDMAGDGRQRVLVHVTGFRQSPYADIKPAGVDGRDPRRMARISPEPEYRDDPPPAPGTTEPVRPARKLWHASPGSSGR